MTVNKNNIISINKFKSNNASTLSDDCKELIITRNLDAIKTLVNNNPDDILEIARLIKNIIFSGYIDCLDWLLSEYEHILALVNVELLDNVLMSSNVEMLELILKKYYRFLGFYIIYAHSIDKCILRKDYEILQILKKYDIQLPKERIIYVATQINTLDEVTPYLF
ncbi:hypothetical protein [Clostridium butyricum]|uniref:hypothetical protein n=1 Tax=Clostridium butyricum TaxID=1492 RepID=UPI0011DD599D|nr:hypothetical protein [Clostridium butyricum]MCQ2017143.1 hypothetical protein [Clostridium butyricum]MCQ2023246.1 hypothetical protein [Clostridium butyricum]NFB73491.1 hypothetical protein [Clostridium butyricum]NFB90999.1 hypothetical protein [Clostridium butyricum]UTY53714.1 hypothetical protein HNS01_11640 [Clostridium butyricum]